MGNITGALSSKGITSYTYDPTDQLTVANHPSATALSDELYSYDAVGNRLSSTDISGLISYNANNELIGHTTVQYQYDANGNTTQKTANGQTTTYDYNSRNLLSRVHLPDGRLVSYRYDPFGRRISKTVAGVTTCYTYSDEGLAAEYDANGTWQKSYGWKPDSLWGTAPVYQRTATGRYYYHNDHLGTPQRLSDESGDIAWSAGYTAFGNATMDPILSTIDNNLRFPGQYFDLETGLHYNYQRFYDPSTGRYTTTDPLREGVNLYSYVSNRSIIFLDPYGLYGFPEFVTHLTTASDTLLTMATSPTSGRYFPLALLGIVADQAGFFTAEAQDGLGKKINYGAGILGVGLAYIGGGAASLGISTFGLAYTFGTDMANLKIGNTNQTTTDWWVDFWWDYFHGAEERFYLEDPDYFKRLKDINNDIKYLREINKLLEEYNKKTGSTIKNNCL